MAFNTNLHFFLKVQAIGNVIEIIRPCCYFLLLSVQVTQLTNTVSTAFSKSLFLYTYITYVLRLTAPTFNAIFWEWRVQTSFKMCMMP